MSILNKIKSVKEFHDVFGIENKHTPDVSLPISEYELRHRLFAEENDEYLEACKRGDLVEVADAIGDMMYILFGTALKHGLQYKLEEVFDEIHRSNMSKLDENGKPIRREDGKILKSALYTRPDISTVLKNGGNIHIERFSFYNKHLFDIACQIREVVFVIGQNVDREEEYDEFEPVSNHYLAFVDGVPAATCRWRRTENGIKMERYAVMEQFRGKNVGKAILEASLNDVKPFNTKLYLHAQVQAMDFYAKSGFVPEGPMFEEANIEHYKMVYKK